MLKGFLSSLIVGMLFFAAGGVSIAVLGTNKPRYSTAYVDHAEWGGQQLLIDEEVTGERTWYFNELEEIAELRIGSSNAKTYIAPSPDNTLMISAKSDDWKGIQIRAEYTGGVLDISVGGSDLGPFIFNVGYNGTVMIGVPDEVYQRLTLDVGSGSLAARGLAARTNTFNIGSGSFEFEQRAGFRADDLSLEMGSGTVRAANAATERFYVDMGSGNFDIGGLTGAGNIYIGSGSGTVEFTSLETSHNIFDLGSGKLTVYIPGDTKADLHTDIGSGVVTVDCCGVSQKIYDDSHITLNGGSNDIVSVWADLGSGKVELLDSSNYSKPNMFGDFPNTFSSAAAVEEAILTEASGFTGQFGYSGAEYIGSVTYAESSVYISSDAQTGLYWEYID